jgi:CheY-like chemotaxis protein
MPILDGLETTRRIREMEQNGQDFSEPIISVGDRSDLDQMEAGHSQNLVRSPRQIIIGISANSDEKTVQEALKSGMNGFLPKPLTMATFREYIYQFKTNVE